MTLRMNKKSKDDVSSSSSSSSSFLETQLNSFGYGRRIMTLSQADLPVIVECQQQGENKLVRVTNLIVPETTDDPNQIIKLEIQSVTDPKTKSIVDLGQITTIWQDHPHSETKSQTITPYATSKLPLGHIDRSLDQLYNSHVGRARNINKQQGLTKKQLTQLVAKAPPLEQNRVDQVLRQVLKTGAGYARLVDSELAQDYLFDFYRKDQQEKVDSIITSQRAMAANALAADAKSGGRFKRMSCLVVSHSKFNVTLVNGGWIVVDQNVRATSEARKFAERGPTANMADERILNRLECLAMGDEFMDLSDLHVDIRETLRAMDLPVSVTGAKDALIRIGRWTSSLERQTVDPWPKPVLGAAKWYQEMDTTRRTHLSTSQDIEGRTDLSRLPCICIDAAKTTFRDDAIGIRTRASTGRRVSKASKWEILLHIADVSDLYSPQTQLQQSTKDANANLQILLDAAASRGTSRYDLPLGPLHLLPPIALHALALKCTSIDLTSSEPIKPQPGNNRCVTVWVYVDEDTGKLLDAGVERTLISRPLAFSYSAASSLLDGTLEKKDPVLDKARAIMSVADRNLSRWGDFHRSKNKAAQARERRLAARELVGKQMLGGEGKSFNRSRGHRLVDSSLDLYGFALNGLLQRVRAPIPRVAGSGRDRLGRVATAPLRRYIDGMTQRQALSVLCGYGGKPLSKQEAAKEGQKATLAVNSISNMDTIKQGKDSSSRLAQSPKLLRSLQMHLEENENKPVPAMSTGKKSEVVILGVGAVASCKGIQGTLKPGEKVMVKVQRIDKTNGRVSATLCDRNHNF